MIATRMEEYIEVIYEVVQKKGYAKVKDIAPLLNIGLPAVSEMFQKLSEKGYINYEKYSGVTLTRKGRNIAVKLSKKHKAFKDFFIILGISEKTADEDACSIEHVVKPETMKRFSQFVEFIQKQEDSQWLKRFRRYYETGEFQECPKSLQKDEHS